MDVRFCRRPACSAVTLLACLLSYKCTFQYLFKKLLFFWRNSPPLVQGLLIHEVSRLHTMTQHSQYDSYGRVMGSSQKPLPDNTHHSQQTDFHAPVGFEPTISAGERPQTYALDRAATGTGKYYSTCNKKKVNIETSKTRQFNNDNNNTWTTMVVLFYRSLFTELQFVQFCMGNLGLTRMEQTNTNMLVIVLLILSWRCCVSNVDNRIQPFSQLSFPTCYCI